MGDRPHPATDRMSGWQITAFPSPLGPRAALCALLFVALSLDGHAQQDYTGLWEATVTVSVAGQQETGAAGDVIFHTGDNLFLSGVPFCDGLSEHTRLERVSDNTFVLPEPVSCTLLGVDVTLTSYAQTFDGSDSFSSTLTGTASVGSRNFAASGTVRGKKIDVTMLTGNQTVTGLSGSEDSVKAFSLNLPTDTERLTVSTDDGSGDPDLEVLFSRPPFDLFESTNGSTQELVNVKQPDSGTWYIMVYGLDSYRDVSLTVSRQSSSPAPTSPSLYNASTGVLGLADVAVRPGSVQFQNVQIELGSGGGYRILAAQASSGQQLDTDAVPVFDSDNRILNLPRVVVRPGDQRYRDVEIWLGENGEYQILFARPE